MTRAGTRIVEAPPAVPSTTISHLSNVPTIVSAVPSQKIGTELLLKWYSFTQFSPL